MYASLVVPNPQSLRLIQNCLSLENKLNCQSVTDIVWKADNNPQGLWSTKKLILDTDWKACPSEETWHLRKSLAAKIATHTTWPKLWDMALDHGTQGTAVLQALYRTLTRSSFCQNPCPFCDHQTISFWTLHHLSYCMWTVQNEIDTPFASPEFIAELLVRESTAKHFLHPVSLWSLFFALFL